MLRERSVQGNTSSVRHLLGKAWTMYLKRPPVRLCLHSKRASEAPAALFYEHHHRAFSGYQNWGFVLSIVIGAWRKVNGTAACKAFAR